MDISYTKIRDQIDNNPYNSALPPKDQFYVGWTEPGEWFNMTVDVEHAGVYDVDLLYTSNRGGGISLDLAGKAVTGMVEIASTFSGADPLVWRQWHHWNVMRLTSVRLPKGVNVLSLRVLSEGNMNFAYLEFTPKT